MFKNATFFRFAPAVGMDVLCRLGDAIRTFALRELQPMEMATTGFVQLPGFDEAHAWPFDYWIGSMCYVIVAIRERKISMPQVNEIFEKKVKQRAFEEGRNIGGRERRRMREEIILDLMPHAPIVTKYFDCLIHCGENWIAVNTGSANTAEHCVGQIRAALGSFPALFLNPQASPRSLLTAWLAAYPSGDDSEGFDYLFGSHQWSLGNKCKLKGEDDSVSSYSGQEMSSEEIAKNLEAGKHVLQLEIVMRDNVRAILNTDLVLKSIKFLDGASMADAEDQQQILALQALELERVARDLFAIFQCEVPE